MVLISIPAIVSPALSDIQSEFEIDSDCGHFDQIDGLSDRIDDWVETTLNKEAEEVPMLKDDSPEESPLGFPATNLMKEVSIPRVQFSLPRYPQVKKPPKHAPKKTQFCSSIKCYCDQNIG